MSDFNQLDIKYKRKIVRSGMLLGAAVALLTRYGKVDEIFVANELWLIIKKQYEELDDLDIEKMVNSLEKVVDLEININ